MNLRWGLFIITALANGCLPAHSQSRTEIYDLQERCAKSAAEMFEKDFPKDNRQGSVSYENNYNVHLNKCFMLDESTTTIWNQDKTKMYRTKALMLVDVNGNKLSGNFNSTNGVLDGTYCEVQQRKCHTEQEFRTLVRPFMED
jgi:hypothetical protein